MNLKNRYSISFFFMSITITSSAQSIHQLIRDDRKSILIESIKPPVVVSDPDIQKSTTTVLSSEEIKHLPTRKFIGNGGIEFEDKYHLGNLKLPNEKQLFEVSPGDETRAILYNGKIRYARVTDTDRKLDQMSLRNKLEGVTGRVQVGGLNLSGWKPKKLSDKSKKILREVFNMEVEE